MQTVALIDYGSGNLRSAEKALQAASTRVRGGARICVTSEPELIGGADRIVLPGVGAFAACMRALNDCPGLVEAMTLAVRRRGAPFLGVCVGMQLLASRGLEFGVHSGLGWIDGEVRRLEADDPAFKIPHMGWNDVVATEHPGFLEEGSHQMYFTHSYVFHPKNPGDVAAASVHGRRFASAVVRDNVAGVQFHPEKSQSAGLALIKRFLEWRP